MPRASKLGRSVLDLDVEDGRFVQGLARNRGRAQRFTDDTGRMVRDAGRAIGGVGESMTRNLTLPIVAAGGAVSKMGFDFDVTLREIVALTSVTGEQIGGIREELLKLGPEVGKSPQELAEAFYFVASAGFEGAEALDVIRVTSKAAAAGLGDTATVAKVVGTAINAYGRDNITAAQATDTLVAAIGEGSAEAPEFAGALGNVIGSAAQIGASFPDVTAAIAAMTNVGIGAEEAVTSLNQIFVSLFKPTVQAEEALEGMGLSAAGLREMIAEQGLLPTLEMLSEKFEGNAEATAAVFGNVRALRGVLALTGGDADKTAGIFERMQETVGATGEAFSSVAESDSFKLQQSMAELQATGIELGADVLPVVVDVLGAIADMASSAAGWWRTLDEDTQGAIVQFLAFVAVAGPTLIVVGKLVTAFGGLVTALTWLNSPKGLAATAAKLPFVTRGVAAMLGPLGLVAAAVGALYMAFETNFLGIRDILAGNRRDTDEWSHDVIQGLTLGAGSLGGIVNMIAGNLVSDLDSIRRVLEASGEDVNGFMKRLGEYAEATDQTLEAAAAEVVQHFGAGGSVDTALSTLPVTAERSLLVYDEVIASHMLAAKGIATSGTQGAVDAITGTLDAGAEGVGTSADLMLDPIQVEIDEARTEAMTGMQALLDGLRGVLTADEDTYEQAWQDYLDAADNVMSAEQRRKWIEGKLASSEFQAGLHSDDPAHVQRTADYMNQLLAEYELLAPGALAEGNLVNPALEAGVASNLSDLTSYLENDVVRSALASLSLEEAESLGLGGIHSYAEGIEDGEISSTAAARNAAARARAALGLNLYGDGQNVATSWAKGLSSMVWFASEEAQKLAAAGAISLRGLSPPKEGPLSDVDEGAMRIGLAWAGGWDRAIGAVIDSTRNLASVAADELDVSRIQIPTPALADHLAASEMAGASYASLAGVQGVAHVTVVSQSVVPGTARELRDIGERVGPAIDDYFNRNGRFGRRPRN